MSRLILNEIFLKYAGIVVSIEEHKDARAEYIGLVSRAGEETWGGGELARLVPGKAVLGLGFFRERLKVTTAGCELAEEVLVTGMEI